MKRLIVKIETLSPIHLGGGKADVIVDAEVVHDEFGLPYFPAKRFKGLLYESALELHEISKDFVDKVKLDHLFGHDDNSKESLFSVGNLVLADYEEQRAAWEYLNKAYPGYFGAKSVLETYTELRYSTRIDDQNGTAEDGSLHNMRLVDKGICFVGAIDLVDDSKENVEMLKLALNNLRFAGAKRNRGCGNIKCSIEKEVRI